jgi:hypothetical protein
MPDEHNHLQFWHSNDALSRRLERESEFDWSLTTMFYAALHLVDAVLSREGAHPLTHAARQSAVRGHPLLARHWSNYRLLEDLSRDARYNCVSFSAAVVRRLRVEHFEPLEQTLRASLQI